MKHQILRTAFLSLTIALGLPACVSSSRHKALEGQLEDSKKELAIAKTVNSQLQSRLGKKANQNTDLEISMGEMKDAMAQLRARKKAADERIARFQELTSKFQSLVDAGKLQVKIVDGRMILALASDVLFASGSATLSEEGKSAIAELAPTLSGIEERKFQVEGHTDNVPIRSSRFPSNWELASARAISVLKMLEEAGLDRRRVSSASFADSRPVAANDSEESRRLNRRIEIAVLPDLGMLPGAEDLEELSKEQQKR